MLRGLFILVLLFAPYGARASAPNTGAGQIADAAGFTASQYGTQIAKKEEELAGIPDTPENKAKRDKLKAEIQDLKNKKATAEMLQQQAMASQGNATKGDDSKAPPPPPPAKAEEQKKEEPKKPKEPETAKIEMPKTIEAQVVQDTAVKTEKPEVASAGPSTGKADLVDDIEARRFASQMTQIAEGNKTAVNSLMAQTVDLSKVDMKLEKAPPVTIAQKLKSGAPAPQAHRAPPTREAQVERGWSFH